jgi:hypothetical protein
MEYPETESKIFSIIDEIMLQFKSNATIVFDEKNKTEEYALAKKMLLDYELVKYILPSEKKKLIVLTSTGAEVVSKGGISRCIDDLERQKDFRDKLKFEKIQNDINKHVEAKRITNLIIVLICIAFVFWVIRWMTN